MKQLLSNQNIFDKLQRNLIKCLKQFHENFKNLEESKRQNSLIENTVLFEQNCNQSDIFSAQIQSYDLKDNIFTITDGIIRYTVYLRDSNVFDNANFFDTPHNSLVVIRQWSYQISYAQNTFSIKLVVNQIRCVDIITTIFYCKLDVDFTKGYEGINKSSSLSPIINEYSIQYFKAIQLLKQFLIHDAFLNEFYNSTRKKLQPKLLILSTIKPKLQQNNQDMNESIQKQDDFEDGCVLQKVLLQKQPIHIDNLASSSNLSHSNKNSEFQYVNGKKRSLSKQSENPPIANFQKQTKLFKYIDEDIDLENRDIQLLKYNEKKEQTKIQSMQ